MIDRFPLLIPLLLAAWLGTGSVPARSAEDCKVLLARVIETVMQDSSILARVRGDLERASELCAAGKNEDAVRLLRKIAESWMPMGMGK